MGVLASVLILLFAKLKENEVATAFVALAMCVVITLNGIAVIFGGLRQAKTGRTSKLLMWVNLGLVILFLILYYGVFSVLKG